MKNGERSYRFALIADIHIDLENNGENTYFIHAEENFRRTLSVAIERGCEFIVSAGDQVTNATGAKPEWRRYREIIEDSPYRGMIFEALGNHELRFAKYGGCTLSDSIGDFIAGTQLEKKPVSRPAGAPYYEYLHPLFGDAFLFMATENGYDINRIDNFSDRQMDWAERLIPKRLSEGRRVFLIQHAPLFGFGAGDDTENPAYLGSIRTADEKGEPFSHNLRFRKLIEKYMDVIWVSGHTHLRFEDEKNYSNNDGAACHMLHIPALSGATRLCYDKTGKRTLDRAFRKNEAQGYLVDVYEDKAVFSGYNFMTDTFYPQYTFII